VRSLTVDRASPLPENHFRFAFPAQAKVTTSSDARAVARAMDTEVIIIGRGPGRRGAVEFSHENFPRARFGQKSKPAHCTA
jgi:hypothetical protein